MQLRHVVTCFLLNPADGTVLLGRRSKRVATYAGYWAAISGGMDAAADSATAAADGATATPALRQAYREVEEETGLQPSCLQLVCEGWPVRFPDWRLGIVWVVHPFLFRCDAPDRVRPDWEHVRFEWMAPSRMRRLRTVPKLQEAYESVAAGTGRVGSKWVFDQIRKDREHGAEGLGLWTLDGLSRALQEAAPVGPAGALAAMKGVCREAAALRPSMASVRSAALHAYGICRQHLRSGGGGALSEAQAQIAALMARREAESLAAADAAAALIADGARLLTLSCSFTVLCVLRESAGRLSGLTVAESRPGCEGRETARLAASLGIPTELVTDAAAARAAQHADILLFGADALRADGSIVNKTGTFALCCAARYLGTRSVCVASESKVLPAGFVPPMEDLPPQELGSPVAGASVRNVCFETVPADLVDRIVGPGGEMSAARLRSIAEELRQLQDSLSR
jgi:ribose 1,5-bisphosphate isomerase